MTDVISSVGGAAYALRRLSKTLESSGCKKSASAPSGGKRPLARRMSSMQLFAGGGLGEATRPTFGRKQSTDGGRDDNDIGVSFPDDGEGRLRRLGRLAMLGGQFNLTSSSTADDTAKPAPIPLRRRSVRIRLDMLRNLAESMRMTPSVEGGEVVYRRKYRVALKSRVRDSRFKEYGEAQTLFRLHARRVFMLKQWMSAYNSSNQKHKEMQTFIDMANELEHASAMKHREEASGFAFNPKDYAVKREIILPNDIKKTLGLMSEFRTPEMVQRIVACLQALPSFSEYPLHMQEKLGKVAWYEEVAEKRLILREGDHADNFYFILSGQAIVKKFVRDAKGNLSMNVMGRIGRGQGFGEIALLYRKQRSASVESATNMTLLVIRRDDFMEIFVKTDDGEEPQHIKFLRGIKFLEHWPVESLHDNPEKGLFHYFRRGEVIVPDSRKSDWIYVVMSGTCRVLKKLNAVTPIRNLKPRAKEIPNKLKIYPTQPTKVDSGLRVKTPQLVTHLAATIASFVAIQSQCSIQDPGATEQELDEAHAAEGMPVAELSSGPKRRAAESIPVPNFSSRPTSNATRVVFDTRTTVKSSNEPHTEGSRDADDKKKKRPTLKMKMPPTAVEMAAAEARAEARRTNQGACFVQLRTLRVRDVFGLEEVQFDEERNFDPRFTAVTLVSNGAELVMVKREFFEKLANEKVKQHIREKVWPLPNDDTLQENLQCKVNWNFYRSKLVHTLIHRQRNVRRYVQHPPVS